MFLVLVEYIKEFISEIKPIKVQNVVMCSILLDTLKDILMPTEGGSQIQECTLDWKPSSLQNIGKF